ncbi:unnamed protein product [Rhizophagus irregularis]|nr:unnamed protein product [Rhizophagus irregularis]
MKQKKDENARNSYLSKTQMLSWQHESDEKPGICEVISKLNSIVPIMSEKKMKYQLILISKKAKRRTN